ncbi:MAG: hypothetical protein JWM04_1592, partial [Verrucomicrobiales bacterium]|nr:hypothetical protein [Verrucomicrobiales bacterium]
MVHERQGRHFLTDFELEMGINSWVKPTILLGTLLLFGTFTPSLVFSQPAVSSKSSATAPARTAAAADAFLSTLDDAARAKGTFDYKNEEQRQKWSNLPSPMFKRAGLKLGELTPAQRTAAMAVMAAALSTEGYQKVVQIMDADETLKTGSGGRGGPTFGKDEFYISLLGKPSATEPWMIQFGGHHLALNVTIIGKEGILTPSHTAAQPAIFTMDGKTIRPLGNENDKAFALINALDENQQKK